jgi:uncharacterized protein (TIGR03435 family)
MNSIGENLKTAIATTALLVVLPATSAQSRTFDVASIKPCAANTNFGTNGGSTIGGRLVVHCSTVMDLIRRSYLLFADGKRNARSILTTIERGPAWIDSDRFEIEARVEGNPDGLTMEGPMMQALLEDRFKLKVHRETRDAPVYMLTVAKTGLRVPAAKQSCWIPGSGPRPQLAAGQKMAFCGMPQFNKDGFDLLGDTVADFCAVISKTPRYRLDRIVLDKTGIAGKFDFHFEWPADPPSVSGEALRPDPFDVFSSALQKLGLRLAPGKGPVEVLIVDHVEKPSAN